MLQKNKTTKPKKTPSSSKTTKKDTFSRSSTTNDMIDEQKITLNTQQEDFKNTENDAEDFDDTALTEDESLDESFSDDNASLATEGLLDPAMDLSFENHDIDTLEESENLPVPSGSRFPVTSSKAHDALYLYMREINKFPMLEPEEEVSLARKVQETGDHEAAMRLVTSHLRLVVRIAMDFQRRWMQNVLDLVQEGNIGLMKAVNKFDPEKGIKFSYYAAFWIKAYILKFIMDNWRIVKIGTTQAQRKLFYNLNKERQSLIAQGFDPDATMLSKQLNVTPEEIIEMDQRLSSSDMSLNLPVNDESGSATHMDFLPALGPGIEEDFAKLEISDMLQNHLKEILPSLNDKETYILETRLLTDQPVTLREIGEKFDITRERVRQIETRLLQKIKSHLEKEISDISEDWI